MSTCQTRSRLRDLLLLVLLVVTGTIQAFGDDGQKDQSVAVGQIERIRDLLRNKGFLDAEANQDISKLAEQQSGATRLQLFEQFKMRPSFLLSPPVSRFVIFPRYEDTSLKVVMAIVGIVGTGTFLYAADIGSQYDHGPVTTGLGLGGFSVSLVTALYFLGLPLWEPRGYDLNTVNREIGSALRIGPGF